MLDTVARKLKAIPPPAVTPCDRCSKMQRCKAEGLACQAFVLFKRVSTSPDRWQLAPRFPSKALFELANEPVRFKPAAPHRQRVEVEPEAVDDGDDLL
jgi:hypothetical protein